MIMAMILLAGFFIEKIPGYRMTHTGGWMGGRASAGCREQVCVEVFISCNNSNTVQDIEMKLGSHVANDNTHMYSKGHYSRLNIN